MKIQTNTAANSALGYMRVNNQATERSIQKLSSGFRINRAGDDAAGLAIANKLRADIKGLGQAQRNVAQGNAMLQVMDGATQTVSSILDRMKELATQANSANVGTQSDKLQSEFTQLRSEIDRIGSTTNYQGTKLVDGTFGYTTGAGTPAVPGTPAALNAGTNAGVVASPATATKVSASLTNATQADALTSNVTLSYVNATNVLTATWTTAGGSQSANVTLADGAATYSLGTSGISITTDAAFTQANDLSGLTGTVGVTQAVAGTPAAPGAQTGTTGAFMVSSSGNYAAGGTDLIQVQAVNVNTAAAGLDLATSDISTQAGAAAALAKIDLATDKLNSALGSIGAAQSRFDFASSNVATILQNTQAAESTIRDADMAMEMTSFTKNNILQQAAQSMLSQANQGTQNILQLLRG